MKPAITVLVDTHNHERYIEQALSSVVEQGLPASEMEIVVVDDGSTDRTPEIIEKFAPRVKVVRKKNGGQASAFNAGFAECNGELVAILDGDDWFAKGKIAAVIEALEGMPEVAAASHGYFEFHEETKETKICVPEERLLLNLETPEAARKTAEAWRFLLMGALTVRRKVLERVVPIPEVLVFSADNPIQVAAMAMGVTVLPEALSYYRMHPNNLYAVGAENAAALRRKCEMVDLTFGLLRPMLLGMGVSREAAAEVLTPYWVEMNRLGLRTFGGSRRKTLRTEMMQFQCEVKKPSVGYRLFKYLAMGTAALLLPPQQFYRLRDWYAKEDVGRYRERVFKMGGAIPEEPAPRVGPRRS